VRENGEKFVLEALARYDFKVMLDVGANVGEWVEMANEIFPESRIHAFEISPPTWEELVKKTCDMESVICEKVGLSDSKKTITIRHYQDMPALTTSISYDHSLPFVEIQAEVITGDSYVLDKSIGHIDFLKIDVEGMENLVLKGFVETLKKRDVDLIQFEYGNVNKITRFMLSDFYDLLQSYGYVIGKIYPNYVDFREYSLEEENFVGPNYLACRSDKNNYIETLRG